MQRHLMRMIGLFKNIDIQIGEEKLIDLIRTSQVQVIIVFTCRKSTESRSILA